MRFGKLLVMPAMMLAVAACGRQDRPQMDDALRNDLSLASSTAGAQPQQFVSPVEQGLAGTAPQAAPGYAAPQNAAGGYYSAPAPEPRRSVPVYRSSTRRRTSSSSSSARRSSGGSSGASRVVYAPRPERVEVKKNTKRDAVIGAAAGGALGAITSRDKLKGAIIGAAAGGLLGGIIGNNVDIQHRRVPW